MPGLCEEWDSPHTSNNNRKKPECYFSNLLIWNTIILSKEDSQLIPVIFWWMSQLAVYYLCYLSYLHSQGKWRVSFGGLFNTGLRTLWIKYPAFSSFILSKPYYSVCKKHTLWEPHQSLNTCPHFLVLHLGSYWWCGHEKWTVLGNQNNQAASKGGKFNLQEKQNIWAIKIAGHWNFLRGIRQSNIEI